MTPTEQDKELREKLIELDGELWDYQLDKLVQLIIADRKRVALEARIDELERTMPHTDGMRHYNTVKRRIAELKAQQENLLKALEEV